MATVYSSEQVAKHNTKKDLWVSIHGKVYDLSSYLEDHPGGVDALVEVAGQDATDAFEDLGHGSDARETMERFVVGKLDHDEDDAPKKVPRNIGPAPPSTPSKLISPAVVRVASELLSMSVMVMAGYEAMRRFGRFAISHHWSTSSALINILPWATATSLASYLINRSVHRAFPAPVPAKRPLHFKPTQVVAHPREEDYAVLDPRRYVDLPITSVEKLSSNSNKIIVDLPTSKAVLGLPVGQHIAIRTVIDGAPLSRSYTPTSSNKDRGRLELVIKNYDDGKMTGNYLKHVRVGDKLSVSGPRGQMRYRRGLADSVGMLAGGSGITPMFQIIRAICEDPRDNTKVQLIYANQTEEDILLKAELDEFVSKHGDQFSVQYLLSRPCESWEGGRGRCTQEMVQKLFAPASNKKNKAMLCGPPGMVTAGKEWLVNLGYEHPNSVSKIHDQVFVF